MSYAGVMKRMFLLVALIGAPVTAQQSSPDIVVEGRTISPADARQYVAQVTDTRRGQIARFHRPVCPMAVGLPEDTNRKITARLRSTVQSLGAELAPEQCEANLVVLVTNDSANRLAELRRTRESWFHDLPPADLDALAAEKGPVRAWAVVSVRNEDGERINEDGDKNVPRSMRVKSASIIGRASRLDVEGAVVMIEESAANGKSIAQLADYAAMRGLARTHPPQGSSIPSILTLFETGSNPVSGLTPWDKIYLQALYRLSGTESLSNARSRLSRGIAR